MDRWDQTRQAKREIPAAEAFLSEIEAVCRKHGLSLAHEDAHGGFIIEPMSEDNIEWLREAEWAVSADPAPG